jgi:hypothetical protein
MVYVIQVCRQLSSGVQWITPDDVQRNYAKYVEFHFQNKIVKLVHLFGFIIRKFVTMHGHMNVKFVILYVSVLPQNTCRLLLADRYHEIFHLRGKLRTRIVWYMSCFEHCMSSRLTNSITGLVISISIEVCGTEKHFTCHSSSGYLSGSSEAREMAFAHMMNNTRMQCLRKLSYLEHTLCSIDIGCYHITVLATATPHRWT